MTPMLRVATDVRFREIPANPLEDGARASCADFWARACRDNPALYDGPILLIREILWVGETCEVSFFQSSFSRYLWARAGGGMPARALFASVVAVTADGMLLAGRMAESTSTPHRVQLPGGNVDRADGSSLSVRTARLAAQRELAEEVGIHVPADELRFTYVKSGGDNGDLGMFFSVALPSVLPEVSRTFAEHLAALAAGRSASEFTELLAFSGDWAPPAIAEPYMVDYMEDIIRAGLRLADGRLSFSALRRYHPAVRAIGVSVQ